MSNETGSLAINGSKVWALIFGSISNPFNSIKKKKFMQLKRTSIRIGDLEAGQGRHIPMIKVGTSELKVCMVISFDLELNAPQTPETKIRSTNKLYFSRLPQVLILAHTCLSKDFVNDALPNSIQILITSRILRWLSISVVFFFNRKMMTEQK
jgi:hypothetical protein